MKNELIQLLTRVETSSINDFFRRAISSFKVDQEDLDHIKPDKGYGKFSNL